MAKKRKKIQPLTASKETIKKNIERLYGSLVNAIQETGISKSQWYKMLNSGEITDQAVGSIYRSGVEPTEIIRK